MSGLPLLVALAIMVTFSVVVGALARDICFALGAAAWSQRAFSRATVLAETSWDDRVDGIVVSGPGSQDKMTSQNLRVGLAWRYMKSGALRIGTPSAAQPARKRRGEAVVPSAPATYAAPRQDPPRNRRSRKTAHRPPGYLRMIAEMESRSAQLADRYDRIMAAG